MVKKLAYSELPGWPRLMSGPLAAAYLGVSEGTLAGLPIPSAKIRGRRVWDRKALDAYADQLGLVPDTVDADIEAALAKL